MKKILSIGLILFLCACTTIIERDKTKDLVVSSTIDDSIFLDTTTKTNRLVFIDINNSTSYPFFDLTPFIKTKIEEKGYAITNNPALAYFKIKANVIKVIENSKGKSFNYTVETSIEISQLVSKTNSFQKETWNIFYSKINTVTNDTELSFNEIANLVINKITDVIVAIF